MILLSTPTSKNPRDLWCKCLFFENFGLAFRFFCSAQFIEDVRDVMGIPDWFLTVDSRKTKTLHNGACVQILLHFKGPLANQIEQDFNKLLSLGRLEAPTLYVPGYFNSKRKATISYKQCGVRDPGEKSKQFFGRI